MQDKPNITYSDIGGLDSQKQEVREAVELPLTHMNMYKSIGIDPPRNRSKHSQLIFIPGFSTQVIERLYHLAIG